MLYIQRIMLCIHIYVHTHRNMLYIQRIMLCIHIYVHTHRSMLYIHRIRVGQNQTQAEGNLKSFKRGF